MEEHDIRACAPVLKMTTPQRIHVLEQTQQEVTRGSWTVKGLNGFLSGALVDEREAYVLRAAYDRQRSKDREHGEDASTIDALLDERFGAVDLAMRAAERLTPPPAPRGEAAKLLRLVLLAGMTLKDLIHASYLDQHIATDAMRTRYEAEPEAQEAAALLGVDETLDQIWELNQAYGRAIHQEREAVPYAKVKEAEERGWGYLASLKVRIAGAFPDPFDPEHAEARRTLLAPLHRMEASIRSRRRRKNTTTEAETEAETETETGTDGGDADPDMPEADCA